MCEKEMVMISITVEEYKEFLKAMVYKDLKDEIDRLHTELDSAKIDTDYWFHRYCEVDNERREIRDELEAMKSELDSAPTTEVE